MPVPNGFVRTNASPTLAPIFFHMAFSSISPVTTRPYLGSLSSTECPPTIGIPASFALSAPPCNISVSTLLGKSLIGNPTMFKAKEGVPPIA